ncbi:50S ribosomal protein L3 [Patescibacteria group bacterium]|nr:50S ribosomal protein L3 [Patescibacteria group bacterium]
MRFILAKKLQMAQIFDSEGKAVPVTLVQAGPCFVTQVKSKDTKDGYSAVQIAFGEIKHINKPKEGHLSKIKNEKLKMKNFGKYLREFRIANSEMKLGDEIKADIFKEGDEVKVIGISKGKGFAGVVKRHGFAGGPASHGQKDRLRAPGSIGSTFPERVLKGKRMAGRMGGERVTVEGLTVAKVDAENNIIAIKGAVPGNRGQLLEIISD